jgi:hypothetical protein
MSFRGMEFAIGACLLGQAASIAQMPNGASRETQGPLRHRAASFESLAQPP